MIIDLHFISDHVRDTEVSKALVSLAQRLHSLLGEAVFTRYYCKKNVP